MVDIVTCIADIWYRLGFLNAGDLATGGGWLAVAELYQWADDAAKRIAYNSGVFVTSDSSITVSSGTAVYSLPATHIFTLSAWLGTQPLRLTPVRVLWALDGRWSATSGPSTRCSMDAGSVGTITLYPNPTVGGTLFQILEEFPATLQVGSSQMYLPTVLQDFFSYALLAGARGKESPSAMPEMQAHFKARCDLYEQVIEHLFGAGQ